MEKEKVVYVPEVQIKCPLCHKRMLNITKGTKGTIKIKCPNCKTLSEIGVAFRLRRQPQSYYSQSA